jgi:undecaprenyl-diphosphatase
MTNPPLGNPLVTISPGPKWIDTSIMRRWPAPGACSWMDRASVALSWCGEVSAVWVTVLLAALVPADRLSGREALILGCALATEWVMTNKLVKRLIHRNRPTPVGVAPRGSRRPHSPSMPSSHASSAAFSAVAIGTLTGWIVPMSLLALAIGSARMHLRVHYPTDVVAGWLWGLLCGVVLLQVAF